MNTFTFTVEKWNSIADRLVSGQLFFSTGTMQRMAPTLADFVRTLAEWEPLNADETLTIDLADNWDAACLIHQAAY